METRADACTVGHLFTREIRPMIDRRRFIGVVAAGVAATMGPANGQSPGKVWRIGYLSYGDWPGGGSRDPHPMWQRLRELGYVEGVNLVVDSRYAEGKVERLPELAADLIRLKPDLIVSRASPANLAARNATSTIPIVMATGMDPVREGVVASIRRPGGNVTGIMFASDTNIIAKRMQLLKEAIPRMSRLAAVVPHRPNRDPGVDLWVRDTERAANSLGVQVQLFWVEDPATWADAFAAMVKGRADAVYPIEAPTFGARSKQIADLALKYRMPTLFGARDHVAAGGLMSYGIDVREAFRLAAEMVDKVLKGEKPADMAIQRPTKYELVINLKTAKELGIAIPSSLLARADEVIQ